jgi:hypothetical protein
MPVVTLLVLLGACERAEPTDPDPPADDTDESDDSDGPIDTDVPIDTGEPRPECGPGDMVFIRRQAYPDLQDALDAAIPGDVLEVCPGEWEGVWAVDLDGALTIRGRSGDADDVILTTRYRQRILHVSGLEPHLTLAHLTFTYAGKLQYGSALEVVGDPITPRGSLVIDHCVFEDFLDKRTEPIVMGTGLGRVELLDSTFTNLETEDSVPVLFHLIEGPVRIERSAFVNNLGNAQGAVLIARQSWSTTPWSLSVLDTTFDGNRAAWDGFGVGLLVSHEAPGPAAIRVERTTFSDHLVRTDPLAPPSFPYEGGALAVSSLWRSGALTLDVVDSTFDNNVANHASQVRLLRRGEGEPWTANFTRTSMTRGRGTFTPTEPDDVCINAGMEIHAAQANLTVTLTDVDVGTGAAANECTAFRDCLPAPTGAVSGQLDAFAADWCP